MRRTAALAVSAALLAACGSTEPPIPVHAPPIPVHTAGTAAASTATATTTTAPTAGTGGWTITVYYTAVERFHTGAATRVTGCPRLDCTHGRAYLGRFPTDFVQAVKDEGTGLTRDGRYLNWSYDTGYWLDTAARDTHGDALRPYVSAAADHGVLADGTGFTITDCGREDDGSAAPEPVCAKLRRARWTVTDEFTPGLGGERHVDAYIGPETVPDFTDSDWYVTLTGARLRTL